MRYRSLGRTGIRVSEIGFGAWGIGGDAEGSVAYGPVERTDALAAVARAVELGVTFFDTAEFYGSGMSEALLGEALAGRRATMIIASKVGLLDASGRQDFSAAHMRRALEASLTRLRSDYLDLYQLHSPPAELLAAQQSPLAELAALRAEGKIRAVGVSARSPQDALAAATHPLVDCVQVNFNLLDQRALEVGLFEACAQRGMGVIVRTPLCFGFLTGRYRADEPFHAGDHRSRWSLAQRERWASGGDAFDAWRAGNFETEAQFALRFCLSFPAVSTAIPGMLTPAHAEENTAASDRGPLPERAIVGIRDTYRRGTFFIG